MGETLHLIRRHWLPAAIAAILGLIAGVVYAFSSPTAYSANASLIVNPGTPQQGGDVGQLNSFIIARMESYAALAETSMVLSPVATKLNETDGATALQDRLTFQVPTGSSIITVSATGSDRESAIALANEVTTSLSSAIEKTTPAQSNGKASVAVMIVQKGQDDVQVVKKSFALYGVLGMILGLALALAILWALDSFRDKAEPSRRAESPTPGVDEPVLGG